MNRSILGLVALTCLVLLALPSASATGANHYVPKAGDGFTYQETINVNDGAGNYTGYTETSAITGDESVVSAGSNGTDNASWAYTVHYSNDTGASQSWTSSGTFSFSALTFRYVHGTDNQTGDNGSQVWFWMNNSLPVGSTFYLLGYQMSVVSDNTSYQLGASPGKWISTIYADGTGSYQRNDEYGVFTATYDWKAYFDPATGYMVGYVYTEQDSDSAGNGFTYTDTLFVTSTTYPLTAGVAPPASPAPLFSGALIAGIAILVIVIILIVVVIAVARSRSHRPKLPTHSATGAVQYGYPSPGAPPIRLTPGDQPAVQQIIMRDTVKVNCKFCGALIDSTAEKCPNCGAPRA